MTSVSRHKISKPGKPVTGLDTWSRAEGCVLPLEQHGSGRSRLTTFPFHVFRVRRLRIASVSPGGKSFTDPVKMFPFAFPANKTSRIWHLIVPLAGIEDAKYYAFRMGGAFEPARGDRFDTEKVILDPYARGVFFPPGFSRQAACAPGSNDGKAPLEILPDRTSGLVSGGHTHAPRHTHDLVIYELHVRNSTNHPTSNVDAHTRGTYA